MPVSTMMGTRPAAQRVDAGAIGQPQVEQHEIVATRQQLERILEELDDVELVLRLFATEELLHEQRVAAVVFDEEDPRAIALDLLARRTRTRRRGEPLSAR
jgi:hypothetical protein